MAENEFWTILRSSSKGGLGTPITVHTGANDSAINIQAEYIESHALLPKKHNLLPSDIIVDMGFLLINKNTRLTTKKAILIILAH
ncbi:MAG: hypothetical protein ABH885_00155, partial [Candidatus Omnitrophota bacterium]